MSTVRTWLPIGLLVISNILFALRAQTSPAMGWR
jgi:hypothetical protein